MSVAAVGAGLFLAVAIVLGYLNRWPWAGFAETPIKKDDDGQDVQPAKTLWDWLQLLVIPLVLAGLAFLLNTSQSDRDQRREDQRAALERKIATDAAREEALRAYLVQVSGLMLDRKLLHSRREAGVRTVARTLTLTALRRVDDERRALMVRFLVEARLLDTRDPIVDVVGVTLRAADLRGANLIRADLRQADLQQANLSQADLRQADLEQATLENANLRDTKLQGTNLRQVDLRHADLSLAALSGADLSGAAYDSGTLWPVHFDSVAAGAEAVGEQQP